MPLVNPPYLQVPGIQDRRIRYVWDDWNVEAVDMPLEPGLQDVLHRLSHRAIVAFTISTAEWIFHRFAALSDDPIPGQVAEAAWAQIADFRYSTHHDINRTAWRGPVRGPLGMAVRRIKFAVQQAELGGEPAWRAGRASKLAEHVLPDPAPYRAWRERVLDRLTRWYSVNPDDTLGDPVPRVALDTDAVFGLAETEAAMNEFLIALDYRSNPFLSSPERMRRQGFQGTPYRFDIEADRRRRLEW